jgi:hypothetical protein
MKKFKIRLVRTVPHFATVEVQAEDENEACALALAHALDPQREEEIDWEDPGEADEILVDGVVEEDDDLEECADCGGSTAEGTPDPHACPEAGVVEDDDEEDDEPDLSESDNDPDRDRGDR